MKNTLIQWCDSTINPVMGCDGCELWPSANKVVHELATFAARCGCAPDAARRIIKGVVGGHELSHLLRHHREISQDFSNQLCGDDRLATGLSQTIEKYAACYAGQIHRAKAGRPGFADHFEQPKLFHDRMAVAAGWSAPSPTDRADKPWLKGARRLIFVSDMGDALSANVPFEFLRDEIINNVVSANGSRHLWLWLSKRPARMAQFAQWLRTLDITWPDNLVAMTTVTSQSTAGRVDELRKVPAKFRGLSCEPLGGPIKIDLTGIHWVIAGGGSDKFADPFDVDWALQLRSDCRKAGAAFFLKQLGRNPRLNGLPIKLKDSHGGDWSEWPDATWRVRNIPPAFRQIPVIPGNSPAANQVQ